MADTENLKNTILKEALDTTAIFSDLPVVFIGIYSFDNNELVEKLKDIPTASAKEQLINEYGFQSDGKGGLNPQFEAEFIVFDGMINEKAMGGVTDQRLLREVADNEKEVYTFYNNNKKNEIDCNNQVNFFEKLYSEGHAYVLVNSFRKIVKNTNRNVTLEQKDKYNNLMNSIQVNFIIKHLNLNYYENTN